MKTPVGSPRLISHLLPQPLTVKIEDASRIMNVVIARGLIVDEVDRHAIIVAEVMIFYF